MTLREKHGLSKYFLKHSYLADHCDRKSTYFLAAQTELYNINQLNL
jgi:hypothetical protein